MGTTAKTVSVRVSNTRLPYMSANNIQTRTLASILSIDYEDADLLIRSAHAHQVTTVEIPIEVLLNRTIQELREQGITVNLTMK